MRTLILISLLWVGCAKPEQPPLTAEESQLIDSLSMQCHCKVQREVDIMLLERFAEQGKRGVYTLALALDCDKLKRLNDRQDSAKQKADELARLTYKVIKNEPKYNEILISMTCETDLANSSSLRDIFYYYSTDSLAQFNAAESKLKQ